MADVNKDRDVLLALFSGKAFVKIKQNLEIDKILFSFVSKSNAKDSIDIYIDEAIFHVEFMNEIKNNNIYNKMVEAKKSGKNNILYQSPYGGNSTGNNGNPISRYFTITVGERYDLMFTAYAYPANKSDTGAFIPIKGSKPLLTLSVPFEYKNLNILLYKWTYLERDYAPRRYSMEGMKSTYNRQEVTETEKDDEESYTTSSNEDNGSNLNQKSEEQKKENTESKNEQTKISPHAKRYEVRTISLVQPFGSKGNVCFKCISKDNSELSVVVTKDFYNSNKQQLLFKEGVQRQDIRCTILVDSKTVPGRNLLVGFAS